MATNVIHEPPAPDGWRGRRRTPILGLSVFALSGVIGVVVAFTSCFGTGFVWSEPTVTPTATATPTSTSTPTSTPTPTVTPTPTITPTPSPLRPLPIGSGEHWVLVDISDQTATAMVGNDRYLTALVTTGKDGWETPIGEFRILYRVYDETMTSAAIGAEDYYVLDHVLFTQYFTTEGHALHLNYWRPDYVFGTERTSHGCVGIRYGDAEFFWNFVNVGSRVVIRA